MGDRLKGKTALVFGATGGIGKAISKGFVDQGAVVVPTSRNEISVKNTVAELKQSGNSWDKTIACDISNKSQVEDICAQVVESLGAIDIMACVSGVYIKKPSVDLSMDDWNNVVSVNLTGAFIANQAVGRIMLERGKGSIINIGSLGSFVSLSNTLPYCVSKAGVVMLTQCLSSEWCAKGVRVNAIIPGVFLTDLNREALSDQTRLDNIIKRTPMGRLGELGELVSASVFLASDESGFVTGVSLPVDGGFLAHSGF